VGEAGYRSPRHVTAALNFDPVHRAMTERVPLDQDSARTALDELFALARKYNSSDAYLELMRFVRRFRFYSPFNAMLIYAQMPGAHFVCTALGWRRGYHREIKNRRPSDCDPATDGTDTVRV
jgi:hypothetical protein